MTQIALSSVFKRRSDVRYRRVEDEAVVLRQSAAEVLVLNELGASVLDLANGFHPVCDWVEDLAGRYEVDRERLERDLLEFAAEAREAGLLELVEGGGP
jgi:hypothetical protein